MQAANRLATTSIAAGFPVTPRQLYWMLVRGNVIFDSDWGEAKFLKLIKPALMGGMLDWNLCPEGSLPPTLYTHQDDSGDSNLARELFCDVPNLGCWAIQVGRKTGYSVSCCSPDGWSVLTVYEAMNRIANKLDLGTAQVVMAQDFNSIDGHMIELEAQLRQMLYMRVGRAIFTRQWGEGIWTPARLEFGGVLRAVTIKGNVAKAIREAEEYVDSRLRVIFARPPVDAEWNERVIQEIPPRKLTRAFFRKLERVPRKTALLEP